MCDLTRFFYLLVIPTSTSTTGTGSSTVCLLLTTIVWCDEFVVMLAPSKNFGPMAEVITNYRQPISPSFYYSFHIMVWILQSMRESLVDLSGFLKMGTKVKFQNLCDGKLIHLNHYCQTVSFSMLITLYYKRYNLPDS